MMVLVFLGCVLLTGLMALTLRGGLTSPGGTTIVGMDSQGLGWGVLAFVAAAYVFGPLYGIAIVLSVMIHEFGHVAAFRIAGHEDARFRLIPLMGGVAISDRRPDTQAHDFFITIMGPAICLLPMVVATALVDPAYGIHPLLGEFVWVFAIATGALNFFNLLPFWPLDGGRCVRVLSDALTPKITGAVMIGMSAALAAVAVVLQSMVLMAIALISAPGLLRWSEEVHTPKPMTRIEALVALGAYVFTAAAHFWGGYGMIVSYL